MFQINRSNKTRHLVKPIVRIATLATLTISLFGEVHAQTPLDGVVVRGSATINSASSLTTINQSSNRAVVNWGSFDVGRSHEVRFNQPGTNSATLNRIQSVTPSVIEGTISAPGMVLIQNSAGVLLTGNSKIDVGSFVASSQRIDSDLFYSTGNLSFSGGERVGAQVINRGQITLGDAGLGALVGTDVANSGIISARRGSIVLASGEHTTIDMTGDGMISATVTGSSNGGGVTNSGVIDAGNGRVLLSAGGAASVMDGVINTSGIIRAGSGSIQIVGRGDGTVQIGGTVSASGAASGGRIEVTGHNVEIGAGSRILADGTSDGGQIRIGGEAYGADFLSSQLRLAGELSFSQDALISATGGSGEAGSVVLWSEGATWIAGEIQAYSANEGGFIETSGKNRLGVASSARIDAGVGGEWLLDPGDVRIVDTVDGGDPTYQVAASTIETTLNARSDVTVTTASGNSGPGDITVETDITWGVPSGPPLVGSLTLDAARDIIVNEAITSTFSDSPGIGNIRLEAGRNIEVNAAISTNGSGNIDLVTEGAGSVFVNDRVSVASENFLTVNAAQDVTINGAAGGSGLGLSTEGATLSIAAGGSVNVNGNATGLAEITTGDGGSVTVTANNITTSTAGGTAGRIATTGDAPLTLRAETQSWDGEISSEGTVTVAGVITASTDTDLDLSAGENFVLEATSPLGTASSITSSSAFDVTTQGSGNITINGALSALNSTLISGNDVTIGVDASLTGTGTGNSLIVVADNNFVNQGGNDILQASNAIGRWLLFVNNFSSSDIIGTVPGVRSSSSNPNYRDFDLYNRAYSQATVDEITGLFSDGNRIVYSQQPTLNVSVNDIIRNYGEPSSGFITTSGPYRAGDSESTAFVGGIDIISDGLAANAPVNGSPYISATTGVLSGQGYNVVHGTGTITVLPVNLVITADDAVRLYGATDPTFTATGAYFVNGEGFEDLDGTLSFSTDATQNSSVGAYTLDVGGATSSNYDITYAPGTLVINPASLVITAHNGIRRYGEENPAFSASYQGFVLGEDVSHLNGTLSLETLATIDSPSGVYAITPSGQSSGNYDITYVDGALLVTPLLNLMSHSGLSRQPRITLGNPPLTPGDAAFRTSLAWVGGAQGNPFDLAYSLGTAENAYTSCGVINTGTSCQNQAVKETFWKTKQLESN